MYCIECSKFTKNSNIKIKDELAGKLIFILASLSVFLKSLKLLIKKN